MAEGVRLEIDADVLRRETELRRKVLTGVEQMPAEALATRHVLVGFDPVAGRHLPPALLYPLLDGREHRRVVLLDQVVS